MKRLQLWWPWLLLMTFAALASPVGAQTTADKATARQLFFDASDAWDRQDYVAAADLYRRSNELYPAPTAALGHARALVQLGKLVDAHEQYNAILRMPLGPKPSPAFQRAVAAARVEDKALVDTIPAVVITVKGEVAAEVKLDGRALPPAAWGIKRLVDAGDRKVTATAPGHEPFERTVTVAEGEVVAVEVVLQRTAGAPTAPTATAPTEPPPSPPSGGDEPAATLGTQELIGWSLVGLGGASLVVAAITGGLFLGEKGVVDDECDDQNRCTQAGLDAVDSGRTLGVVNTITLFGGVAAAAVGLTLVLTAEDETSGEAVALTLQPSPQGTRLGLEVSF